MKGATRVTLTAKIHKVFDSGTVRAIASVNIGDSFAVHGVKVLTGSKGDSVVMPSVKYKDKYQDTFHPISREARELISNTVLDAYRQFFLQGPQTMSSERDDPYDMAQAI